MAFDPQLLGRQIAIRREINAAVAAWIIAAFQRCFKDGSDFSRIGHYLGFKASRREAEAERNRWLLEVASDLREYQRAARLKSLVDEFMRHPWPQWRDHDHPPHDATDLQHALFRAAKAGARMDLGRHQLRKILLR